MHTVQSTSLPTFLKHLNNLHATWVDYYINYGHLFASENMEQEYEESLNMNDD